MPLATRLKISNALKGRPLTLKHRNNISKGSLGKKLSMETRLKISAIVKANPPKATAVRLTDIHTKKAYEFPTIISAAVPEASMCGCTSALALFAKGHRNSLSNALKTKRVYKYQWLVSPIT